MFCHVFGDIQFKFWSVSLQNC